MAGAISNSSKKPGIYRCLADPIECAAINSVLNVGEPTGSPIQAEIAPESSVDPSCEWRNQADGFYE
jgi:hypothetical protein